ncbi:MAG: UDP-N-acetylmuramoyl-L-alanine--D-glutamate ligase [Clostridiales bacterium]|jgi:UDP-N-acetylmuramoylalanine--D-glutamate ligase|nr:UDP-N-acetylmuramoyl-L-alanine--D-glutamate ligase [Clostridiales bacterium]
MDFAKKKVIVCGMAKSGFASAELLIRLGARVTLQDIKELEKLDAASASIASALERKGAALYLGRNPDEIVREYDLVVVSPGLPADLPFMEKARAAGVPVWGEIELAYSLCPCPVIAITGTNGKTTTTALTGAILKSHNPKTEIAGNIGVPFAEKTADLTADAWAVVEVSSFQLETVQTFRPKVSVVLNVTPDHLDRHKTMERYVALKESVGRLQGPEDYMVLNFDDLYCREMRTKAKRIFFSRVHPLEEGFFLDGNIIRAHFEGKDEAVLDIHDMRIFGHHNIENTLAAVAAAACAQVPADVIRRAATNFQAVEHRIEFVRALNGVRFYNDSKATNTDAAIKAIEAMREPIVLIGGGYDKHSDFGDWVKMFQGKVKHLVVMGEVAEKIMETCKAYGFERVDQVHSLKNAVELAYSKAEAGDCVLLSPACASWDMFDNYEQRGNLFKEFVRDLPS